MKSRDKRRAARRKRELYKRPSKAEVMKIAGKVEQWAKTE